MTTLMAFLFIMGFMMGGFILGYYVCRGRFNRIENGLNIVNNNIIRTEVEIVERRLGMSGITGQAGMGVGAPVFHPPELSPPPNLVPELDTTYRRWEQLFGDQVKQEQVKQEKPEKKSRLIRIRNDT